MFLFQIQIVKTVAKDLIVAPKVGENIDEKKTLAQLYKPLQKLYLAEIVGKELKSSEVMSKFDKSIVVAGKIANKTGKCFDAFSRISDLKDDLDEAKSDLEDAKYKKDNAAIKTANANIAKLSKEIDKPTVQLKVDIQACKNLIASNIKDIVCDAAINNNLRFQIVPLVSGNETIHFPSVTLNPDGFRKDFSAASKILGTTDAKIDIKFTEAGIFEVDITSKSGFVKLIDVTGVGDGFDIVKLKLSPKQ